MTPSSNFRRPALNALGQERAEKTAALFEALLAQLDEMGVGFNPRYRAMVVTRLEEACDSALKSLGADPAYWRSK